MKRYVAFLRGINVGGKNKIGMRDLKTEFEEMGLQEVKTILNSGNIVFSSEGTACDRIGEKIGCMIKDRFDLDIPVYVILMDELEKLIEKAPAWWGSDDKAIYDNLIFVMPGVRADAIATQIGEPSEGIERVEICDNAIFWSFDLGKHAGSNRWKKTAATGIGEHLTIRTAGTCRKV